MFGDYMMFVVIALVTGIIILYRILSSELRYQEKGFIQLIILTICHNIVDIFWGLTYFDKIGMGSLGLQISTSMYFCSNAVLVFTWFLFLHRLLHRNQTKPLLVFWAGLPMALAILLVIVNIYTGLLFTIGETIDSYARGNWYILERIGTSGYLFVIFVWALIKLFLAGQKSERKRYAIITVFAIVPFILEMIQVFYLTLPCTSIAFQITIILVYSFISVERGNNILINASERQKNNLKTALTQTAMSWYEFNVDTDCIYDGKIYIEKDRYVKRPDQVTESYSGYYNFLMSRVWPEYKEKYMDTFAVENLKRSFAQGKLESSLEYWITDSAGEERYIYQNIILTRDNVTKEIIGFAYTRDITEAERQKQEIKKQNILIEEAKIAAENANNAKTAFLFNMSHDIRTPMNAIVGYSQLMKKEINNPEKLMEYQKKIQMSSEFLLSLLNDVLDMARIESGKEQLDEDLYNESGSVIAEVVRVFEMQAKEKNITLKSSVDVEHESIMCDIVKVREIFNNLVSNAIKYTLMGGCVSISTKEIPSNREGYVLFRTVIEDNGIGMSKEFLPHIFDSFTRERNTTQGKVAGTGLGMAIVKGLVELMEGTIEVESELGTGTKFILTIPHKIAPNDYSGASDNNHDMDMSVFSNKRILLAEDNELNAEITMEILKEAGFMVERAEDGIVCVDMLQKSEEAYYDMILMDIQMPNMDGYKATCIIRRMQDSYRQNIPIIAMTANAFESDKKMAMDSGMNGHIAKPIKVDEMMKTLAGVLK